MTETPRDARGGQSEDREAEQRMSVDDGVLPILRKGIDRQTKAKRDYDQPCSRPMQRDCR